MTVRTLKKFAKEAILEQTNFVVQVNGSQGCFGLPDIKHIDQLEKIFNNFKILELEALDTNKIYLLIEEPEVICYD